MLKTNRTKIRKPRLNVYLSQRVTISLIYNLCDTVPLELIISDYLLNVGKSNHLAVGSLRNTSGKFSPKVVADFNLVKWLGSTSQKKFLENEKSIFSSSRKSTWQIQIYIYAITSGSPKSMIFAYM